MKSRCGHASSSLFGSAREAFATEKYTVLMAIQEYLEAVLLFIIACKL